VLTQRRGFTLVELLVTMVLMGLVASALVVLMLRQQRFYTSTNDLVQTRQQIRQAAAMLPAQLQGVSSSGGDIYAMTDSSIEFRGVFGSSITCNTNKYVTTMPLRVAKNSQATNWLVRPAIDDSVAIYDFGATSRQADDVWSLHRIIAVTALTGAQKEGCKTTDGLVQAADLTADNPMYRFDLSPDAGKSTVAVGSALRFFRRVRYQVFQGSDGRWYLGFSDCVPNRTPVCSALQPVAGPFDGSTGLRFSYYDSTGAVTTNRLQVARISLLIRGKGEGLINLTGSGGGTVFRDSIRVEVGVRNR
jgi:prepilin-type N-terminal cleavage/methylation domain-containing protein